MEKKHECTSEDNCLICELEADAARLHELWNESRSREMKLLEELVQWKEAAKKWHDEQILQEIRATTAEQERDSYAELIDSFLKDPRITKRLNEIVEKSFLRK